MISPTKELIRLHAKQLRMPTFAQYEEVERQLNPSAGYDVFLLELLKRELTERQSSSQKRRIWYQFEKASGEFGSISSNPPWRRSACL